MDNLKNVIKLALAMLLVALLVVAAFIVGYEAGTETKAETDDAVQVDEQTSSSLVEPTATAVQTLLPSATHTVAPTEASIDRTPLPEETVPTPSPSPTQAPSEPEISQSFEQIQATVQPTVEATLSDDEAMQVLEEVWELVNSEFFGELPPPEQRAYGAIRGMLETLDDEYTSFSEPSIAEIRRSDSTGTFEGIGALVALNDENILEIVQPFNGSPAEEAGLLSGDLVIAVDGESIVGYGIYEAITLIRGPEGSEVILTVQRGDAEPFDVKIVRARLDIPIIQSELLEETVAYVNLFEFSSPATSRLEEAIEEMLNQGATSLILDLRGNPGGFLDQAVQVSDLFLDEGLVLIERRSDGQELEFTSTDDGVAQDIPLVVLVNGGSASASEIVAGAIQDRGRAILIGETTFGKGSVQLLHALSDGSELRVTVARWFTPNDRAIHGEGLAPDIVVPVTPEDQEAGQDPQLERAIEYLKTGQ
jgi:carboxyl-terminal processing protease